MGNALLLVLAGPSVIVAGVPDCWVDARRLNGWLRRSSANDNGGRDVVDLGRSHQHQGSN